jgi:hypothetical protein
MSITIADLKLRGSASMPDDDTALDIGGAIDRSKKVDFTDVNGLVQVVSSDPYDAEDVTVSYRDSAGNLLSEMKTLSGVTPVAYVAPMERLLKAIKAATCVGDVAVENQTAERANTVVSATTLTVVLDAGASAVDQAYRGMIVRLTAGTGNRQIREVIDYVGATKTATISYAWGTVPGATTSFRISKGFYFDNDPDPYPASDEVMEVRRPFYDAVANAIGGLTKKYYEKVFFENTHDTLDLTSAVVSEASDPGADIAFGVVATLDDSGGNGGGNNRQVAPAGITFNSSDKDVANGGSLTAGAAQGTWLELTLLGGAAAQNTTYGPRLTGNTT